MDALRDAIRFRGYAQKDPKVEYEREGYPVFEEMNARIDSQALEIVTSSSSGTTGAARRRGPPQIAARRRRRARRSAPAAPAQAPLPSAARPRRPRR